MKRFGYSLFSIIFFVLGLGTALIASEPKDGKALFVENCKACHSLDQRLVGPALQGVDKRRDSVWLRNFILSSQSMIKAGDPVAEALFKDYNQVIMPDQSLSNEEIDAILGYIAAGPDTAEDEGSIRRPEVDYGRISFPLQFNHYSFWIPYTITVLLVIALLWYMVEVSSYGTLKEDSETDEEGGV